MNDLLTFLQEEYINKVDYKLRFLLGKYSIEEIVRHITDWLDDDKLNYFDTTIFARDFYIGSDLTQEEKEVFYNELQQQGFFKKLNNFLYASIFNICSWTIYTIGKFSNKENSCYLEAAYEALFISTNPILAYRCLDELEWLGSKKVELYLSILEKDGSITSKLILLYYWEKRSYNTKFKDLLTNKDLIGFISPNQTLVDVEDEIRDRLFAFENHVYERYNASEYRLVDMKEFQSNAKNFFRSYCKNVDPQTEADHQEFIKQLCGN